MTEAIVTQEHMPTAYDVAADMGRRARAMGIGGGTTDTLPGNTKDDLDIGLESFRSQSLSEA